MLGDFVVQKGRRAKGKELLYPAFSINNQTGFSEQSEQWGEASYTKLEKNGYKVIEFQDFAYNPARINVGSIGLYKGKEPCIVSSLYVCFSAKEELYPDYLFKYLKSEKFNKKVLSTQEGGVRTYFFFDKFQKTKMWIPSKEEQLKVSVFLDAIDKRIETQNKIIEEKKKLIKGINNALFDSSTKELHKLNNLFYQYGGLSGKTVTDFGSGSPYITFLSVLNNYFVKINQASLVKVSDNEKQNTVKYGDVVLTLSSETPEEVGIAAVSKINEQVYLNSFCMGLRPFKHDLLEQEYMPWLFSTRAFREHIFPYAQGSTRFNLNVSSFMNSSFLIPSKKEQICFSKLLNNLMIEVETEEKIIERYRDQKQYLLKNLFI